MKIHHSLGSIAKIKETKIKFRGEKKKKTGPERWLSG